jgi:hypothetical protein
LTDKRVEPEKENTLDSVSVVPPVNAKTVGDGDIV